MTGPAEGDTNAYRAAVSFWAMRHEFLNSRTETYREAAGVSRAAAAWPYSQALAATIAMTAVPKRGRLYIREAQLRIDGLNRYVRADGAYAAGMGSGDVYYDDNEWIALELVQWWKLRHERAALARAARLFGVVRRAWDGDETHPCPGGIFWTDAKGNDDRNTVTTATGALLAMRLYEATRNRGYLTWARRRRRQRGVSRRSAGVRGRGVGTIAAGRHERLPVCVVPSADVARAGGDGADLRGAHNRPLSAAAQGNTSGSVSTSSARSTVEMATTALKALRLRESHASVQ